MITSLYWSQVPEEPKENNIYNLKWILAKKLADSDGSLSQDLGIVDESLIPFLEGVEASAHEDTSEDARQLINAIEKHGKVQLIIHS